MTLIQKKNGLYRSFPSLFEDFFQSPAFGFKPAKPSFVPAVNVKETPTSFQLELAAPGLKKEDFQIELDAQLLTIRYEHQPSHETTTDEQGRYTRREFSHASFKRSFTLPEDIVQSDKIEARYTDGILHLSIPKRAAEPAPAKRNIAVG